VATVSVFDEKKLLEKLRDGDKTAFQEIYNIYARRLAGKLIRLLRSEELAEDVLQDVFVKIWEMRSTIDPDLSFAALLFKMAANYSKNIFRKNVYDKTMRDYLDQDKAYSPIEDWIDQSAVSFVLESALDTLTPRQREIYVMHKLEGRSYSEISDCLKISSSAINHHIQKATKQLQKVLKNQYLPNILLLLGVLLKK